MSRYVDTDELKNAWVTYGSLGVMDMLLDGTFPTIDIVRCKDCKHRDPEDKKCDSGHFIQWQLPRDDEWFCADGEKVTE